MAFKRVLLGKTTRLPKSGDGPDKITLGMIEQLASPLGVIAGLLRRCGEFRGSIYSVPISCGHILMPK